MLGAQGQAVAERGVEPGEKLDVGRGSDEPWGDDENLESEHARLTPAPGGGLLVEEFGRGRVFRRVDERRRVRDGELIRIGQSLVRYDAQDGGWGSLSCFPLSGTESFATVLSGAGAVVGREGGDVEIDDDTYISAEHCRFTCAGQDVFIEDLGSANGTYARVRAGETVPFGALILLGHTQFEICRAT